MHTSFIPLFRFIRSEDRSVYSLNELKISKNEGQQNKGFLLTKVLLVNLSEWPSCILKKREISIIPRIPQPPHKSQEMTDNTRTSVSEVGD